MRLNVLWQDRRIDSQAKACAICQAKVEIFKPTIDVRYDDDKVVSHDSNEIRSTPVPAAANIPILADGCDVVGIDEAQFLMTKLYVYATTLPTKA